MTKLSVFQYLKLLVVSASVMAASAVSLQADSVAISNPPLNVTSGIAFQVTVNYTATPAAIVQLQFFDSGWSKKYSSWVNAAAGTSSKQFSVTIPSETAAGTGYIWQALLYDSAWGPITQQTVYNVTLTSGAASSPTLIPLNSSWRYLVTPSDQGTAWRAASFNDAAWPQGPARLGYGDTQATTIGFGPNSSSKYVTTYFRKTFSVSNPSSILGLNIRLTQDDGAVIYLNGTEVVRSNMPSGTISYSTFASSGRDGAEETTLYPFSANASLLVSGTNVIAAEIHQNSASSSDLGFDMELTTTTTASVIRGPYLQTGTPTSVVVRWRTNTPTNSRVVYGGSTTTLTQSATSTTSKTDHEVTLTGLSPNTRYYYAVGSTTQLLSGGDSGTFFFTSPTAGTVKATRIWVIGDAGTANSSQTSVRDRYYAFTDATTTHTDLWLMLGDNAYETGTDSEYQAAVFNMYATMLRKSVVWSTLGNHDVGSVESNGLNPYFNLFTLPTAGEAGGRPSTTEKYYSFDYANIHFICLDSQSSSRLTTGAMYIWLQQDLAQTTQKWIVAFWHHPPYTKGSHDSDAPGQSTEMRERFVPLLEANGVDLVLSGHSHAYERSKFIDGFYATPTTSSSGTVKNGGNGNPNAGGGGAYTKTSGGRNGTVYTVAGSSGKIGGGTLNHPVMITNLNVLGSVILDVNGNRLDAKFLDSAGVTRDTFRIDKN